MDLSISKGRPLSKLYYVRVVLYGRRYCGTLSPNEGYTVRQEVMTAKELHLEPFDQYISQQKYRQDDLQQSKPTKDATETLEGKYTKPDRGTAKYVDNIGATVIADAKAKSFTGGLGPNSSRYGKATFYRTVELERAQKKSGSGLASTSKSCDGANIGAEKLSWPEKDVYRAIGKTLKNNENRIYEPAVDRAAPSLQDLSLATQLMKEKQRPRSRTIHILGHGPVGQFIAHHLSELPFPPLVTILLHRPVLMHQWHSEGAAIRCLSPDGQLRESKSFGIESCAEVLDKGRLQNLRYGPNREHTAMPPNDLIDCLLVTTEPRVTKAALERVKHRLCPDSTVCFMNDGLGIVDQINTEIFHDVSKRPSYMMGNISHVLQKTNRTFSVMHRAAGTVRLLMPYLEGRETPPPISRAGQVRIRKTGMWPETSRYLLYTLCRNPVLNCVGLHHSNFLRLHLERLAIASILSPLSVIYDCANDQLLYNYNASRTMLSLAEETCNIIQHLPELDLAARRQFIPHKLEHQVLSVIARTGQNITPMLQHVRTGDKTDIEFYNGYLIKRAKELGLACPLNEMVLDLVKGKQLMKNREREGYIPYEQERTLK